MQIIYDAISKAVREAGQGELLTQALIAWFSELSNGNESIADFDTVKRRLDLLLEKTVLENDETAQQVAVDDEDEEVAL